MGLSSTGVIFVLKLSRLIFKILLLKFTTYFPNFSLYLFKTCTEYLVILQTEEAEMQERAKKEAEQLESFKNLYSGHKFYISREVPREPLVFIIR